VVALGLLDSEAEVLAAAESGASGFVLRDACLDELIDCLETVARGDLRCSPSIAGALLRRLGTLASERPRSDPVRDITWREREVLGLVEQGLSNKDIAGRLSIEVTTVKNHIHNILEKLGVRRRSDAAATLRQMPAARRAGALKI
jgi:DNA-binding NarL/FixJ family response regulator